MNYAFKCPRCPNRFQIHPLTHSIPICPRCKVEVEARITLAPHETAFDQSFTPELSQTILDSIPDDSYHWPLVAERDVNRYAELMRTGRWRNLTIKRGGIAQHPVRFKKDYKLQTGVQRFMASVKANASFEAVVIGPPDSVERFMETSDA